MSNQDMYPMADTLHASFTRRVTLAVYLACLIAHVIYVSLYAHEIPFWDQWDAEADRLLRPLQESSLSLGQMFASHNEHRILFSRLLSLALFKLNSGQWNNLVEAYASSVIYAAVPATFVWLASRNGGSRIPTVVGAFAACALAMLPFDFENTLVGFQSQFYFMAEFALLILATACYARPTYRTAAGLTALGLASLFTMASGMFAPGLAIAMLWICHGNNPKNRGFLIAASLGLAATVALGVILFPILGSNLAASGVEGHIHALSTNFMWPMQSRSGREWHEGRKIVYAACVWAPLLAWLIQRIRVREFETDELFVVAVAFWVALQLAAIAHSRGHDLLSVPSRYTDIFAIGLICNAWLASRMLTAPGARWPVLGVPAILFVIAAGSGLVSRTPADLWNVRATARFGTAQTDNVAAYIRTSDPQWLIKPLFEIPYPDAKRLQSLLDNPTIRSSLPSTINPVSPAGDKTGDPASRDGTLTLWARHLQAFVQQKS
jgi:hypothetical protein